MAKGEKKKNKKLIGKAPKIVMLFFAIAICCNLYLQYNAYSELKQRESELALELKTQEQKQAELNAKKDYYISDAYIEEAARDKLGLVRPDERLFINRGDSN